MLPASPALLLLRSVLVAAVVLAPITVGRAMAQANFLDVTAAAGLDFTQLPPKDYPDCLKPFLPGMPVEEFSCMQEYITGGAAAGDFDADGLIDLYVTRPYESDLLFRNLGDGSFADVTVSAGLSQTIQSNGAAWGDIDNDGDLDLYVNTIGELRNYLFINDGAGAFTEQAVSRGAAIETTHQHFGMGVAFGDFDRDGYLDLYTTEWVTEWTLPNGVPSHSRLLRNLGAASPGHFEDVTQAAGVSLDGYPVAPGYGFPEGVFSFAPAFVDLDQDGWPDLAITGDHATSRIFWNDQDGTFTDGTAAAGISLSTSEMGSTFGDYDQDGDLDWFVTAVSCEPPYDMDVTINGCTENRLYRYDGNRVFSEQAVSEGVNIGHWGWGAAFLDGDNDGDLDLVMTNGISLPFEFPHWMDAYHHDPVRYWRNDGSYVETAAAAGLTDTAEGKGLLVFDYDKDGDQDVLILNTGGPAKLYRNVANNTKDFIRVKVVGGVGTNSDGVGAIVEVTPIESGPVRRHEIGAGSHFLGQSEQVAHFGLDELPGPRLHRLEVTFPASGKTRVINAPIKNRTHVVREPPNLGCGMLGAELLLPVALLRLGRRRRLAAQFK